MTRQTLAIYSLAAIALVSTTFAISAATRKPYAVPESASPRANVVANAPNARLAALIDGDSDGFTIVRQKRVKAVTRPNQGVYCILPEPNLNLNIARIVPNVSPEWNGSSSIGVTAQYFAPEGACPPGRITVITAADTGSWGSSNEVAFTIVVP